MSNVRVEQTDDAVVVSFADARISDETRIIDIGEELQELVTKIPGGRKMVLDFQRVEYFSSAMVGQLLQLHKASLRSDVDLRLQHISPTVREILQVMQLDQIFRIDVPEE